jgi:microsomal dipeptidase-like Zn-dependent dipeptidase
MICAFVLGSFVAQAQGQKPISGYYAADDGGAYYLRQIGNKIYWFGEDPDGSYANVLSGEIAGNKITARWVDVPKGKTKGQGEITFEIRDAGATLIKLNSSAPFGVKTLKLSVPHTEFVGGVPVVKGFQPEARSRPAGFLGGENNLTAVWMGDDYAYYYVRELADGEVVWVAEHSMYGGQGGTARPNFTHVFFGKKAGNSISGQWVDVPKGKTASNGTLTVTIKDAQDLQTIAKTGGFPAGEFYRSLPNSLRGFADLHTHPMINLSVGGKLVHGGTDVGSLLPADSKCNQKVRAKSIEQALGTDNSTHGGYGAFDNTCGDDIRKAVIDNFQEQNKAVVTPDWAAGYPSFKDWPKWNDITHQKMWVDWLRRAYDGGQRVLVALAMNNATIAAGVSGPGDGPTDDRASADLQIAEIKSFVARHNDFMEVAYTPTDLRRIVAANKLAVVIGAEIDNIGNFNKVAVTEPIVRAEINRLYKEGVRYIFPVHLIDNKFGGTALYKDVFNLSNYRENGNFWNIECGKPEDKITYKFTVAGFDVMLAAAKGVKLGVDIFRNPPDPPKCVGPDNKFLGHKNARGLTALGKVALDEMMNLGMLIDIDHMSQSTANATLGIAEKVPGGYPLVSGHNSLRSIEGSENNRTEDQLERISKLGGMFGLGSDGVSAVDYVPTYSKISQLMGAGRVSFGSDLNGLVKGPRPRAGATLYGPTFPMSSTGDKKWDYSKDGVAHYGMMTDFLRDMYSMGLGGAYLKVSIRKNAEFFAQMWEKAEKNGKQN